MLNSLSAEFADPNSASPTAESSQYIQSAQNKWITPPEKLFSRLSSTHLNVISPIDNPIKRAFYEMEAIRGCWSVKELERQINSLYYERSGLSKNKEALSALVQRQATPLHPKDIINTPVTLEFLGLNDRALVTKTTWSNPFSTTCNTSCWKWDMASASKHAKRESW